MYITNNRQRRSQGLEIGWARGWSGDGSTPGVRGVALVAGVGTGDEVPQKRKNYPYMIAEVLTFLGINSRNRLRCMQQCIAETNLI